MYRNTQWIDEVKDQDTEEVIQEGTPQSAGNFNNMEHGISDAHLAAALLIIQSGLTADQVATEEKAVTLSNSQSYPFNNSTQTIALSRVRNFTDYTVEAEITDHDGNVGDVRIFDRMLNGFKVAYDGSAKSATIKLRIKGGM
ncbi:hypothetical protein D7X48_07835 [bacterium D16-50]|jgi:hypothetical protein|nr:hypothetical protein [Acetatifactor sp.]RKJ20641.1 hypothetical protein D7X48_07835 [bacterium D16-50]